MKRFVQGECRTQSTLLPELLDDYITENNPVRVVDVFVDELDLGKLGFEGKGMTVTPIDGSSVTVTNRRIAITHCGLLWAIKKPGALLYLGFPAFVGLLRTALDY